MVIFYSYVSLPEGRNSWILRNFSSSEVSTGKISSTNWIFPSSTPGRPTWVASDVNSGDWYGTFYCYWDHSGLNFSSSFEGFVFRFVAIVRVNSNYLRPRRTGLDHENPAFTSRTFPRKTASMLEFVRSSQNPLGPIPADCPAWTGTKKCDDYTWQINIILPCIQIYKLVGGLEHDFYFPQ